MEKWVKMIFNGENFDVETDTGNLKVGDNSLSPMSLLLVSLGGCTAMDVTSILKKLKKQFDLRIEVRGRRANEHPKVYTEIYLTYEVAGDVAEKELLRAVSLSLNKYCSVSAMISKACPIFYRVILNGREIENGKKGYMEDKGS